MRDQLTLIDYIFWACDILFDVWFILPLNIIKGRKDFLRNMIITWVLWDVLRIFIFFDPGTRPDLLIPEPLNTLLFFITGALLIGVYILQSPRKPQQRKRSVMMRPSDLRKAQHLQNLTRDDFIDVVITLLNDAGHQAWRVEDEGPGIDARVITRKGETCLVRCFTENTLVDLNTLISTFSDFSRQYNERVILATPGKFDDQAVDWAQHNPITLYDSKRLWQLWSDFNARGDRP